MRDSTNPTGGARQAPAPAPAVDIEVVALDPPARPYRDVAAHKVGHLVDRLGHDVRRVEVKLSLAPDPAVARPAGVDVTLDLGGSPLRAHATAATVDDAVDAAVARLRDRLEHRAERRRARRRLPG